MTLVMTTTGRWYIRAHPDKPDLTGPPFASVEAAHAYWYGLTPAQMQRAIEAARAVQ